MRSETRFPHTECKPIEVDNLEVFREMMDMAIRIEDAAKANPRATDPSRVGRLDLTCGIGAPDREGSHINFGLRIGIAVGYLAGAEHSDELMPEDDFIERVVDIINLWRPSENECNMFTDYNHLCRNAAVEEHGHKRYCADCAAWKRANPHAGDIRKEA